MSSSKMRFDEDNAGVEESVENGIVVTADDFINIVRYGAKAHVQNLVEQSPHLLSMRDSKGHTCMHWAAKRGSVDILQYLYEKGAPLDLSTSEEPYMMPIHWAAAEGKLDALQFFLDHNQNINLQDGNSCSIAVVAVQFNQLQSLVYLAKRGADLTIRDTSGDHCLHWAAYKGYEELMHVILYFLPSELNSRDNFGQTPLHLAAIKGHAEVVRSLLSQYHADCSIRDKGGLTPLEHAVNKGNFNTEWIMRGLLTKNWFAKTRTILMERTKEKKYKTKLMFIGAILCGVGAKEQSVWLWRGTFFSNFFATLMSLYYAFHPQMADLYMLHFVNTIFQVMWWICFLSCSWREPGYVYDTDISGAHHQRSLGNGNNSSGGLYSPKKYGDSNSDVTAPLTGGDHLSQQSTSSAHHKKGAYTRYDEGLDIIAKLKDAPANVEYKLCHTCHCVRPLRSKHDKMINRCVHKFDHFCPFVDGSIGRDNYKFFLGLLFMHPWAYGGFITATVYFFYRVPMSYLYWCFLFYATGMFFMLTGLMKYHFVLCTRNLTTNEDMGLKKYKYLQDDKGEYNNPFDTHSRLGNFLEVLAPDAKSYYSREEVLQERFAGLRRA